MPRLPIPTLPARPRTRLIAASCGVGAVLLPLSTPLTLWSASHPWAWWPYTDRWLAVYLAYGLLAGLLSWALVRAVARVEPFSWIVGSALGYTVGYVVAWQGLFLLLLLYWIAPALCAGAVQSCLLRWQCRAGGWWIGVQLAASALATLTYGLPQVGWMILVTGPRDFADMDLVTLLIAAVLLGVAGLVYGAVVGLGLVRLSEQVRRARATAPAAQ